MFIVTTRGAEMRAQIAVLIFLFSVSVLAQKQPASVPPAKSQPSSSPTSQAQPGNVASREQIMKLLELLQVPDSLAMTMDAMKEQMKVGALQMFREKVNNPSPEQIKSVDAIVDEEFKKIGMEDLIEDVVPIYQKHLTRSDVEAVIKFYSSPVGQKIRREQPAMARESLQATSAGQRSKMELLLAKLDLRIDQLARSEENKTAPDKKQ
jgi:uncharacterized protein